MKPKHYGVYIKGLDRWGFLLYLLKKSTPIDWDKPFLKIVMPCGKKTIYNTMAEIPGISIPCPCGDKEHWVIYYESEESRDVSTV